MGEPTTADWSRRASVAVRVLAAMLLLVGVFCGFVRFAAFDVSVGLYEQYLSTDGMVSPSERQSLGLMLLITAAIASVLGGLAAFLSTARGQLLAVNWIRWDAWTFHGLPTLNPVAFAVVSTFVGVAVLLLWVLKYPIVPLRILFKKEGPLEILTFGLDLLASVLLTVAVIRWRATGTSVLRAARKMFAIFALLLFVVAMEEVAWGQTLFHFPTPETWSALNHQGETTIHNFAERSTLTLAWQVMGTLFAIGLVALTMISRRAPLTLFGVVAPPPSLLFLGLIAAGSVWLHPEMIELILSMFVFFYAVRVWIGSSAGRPRGDPPSSADRSAKRRLALSAMLLTALLPLAVFQVDWMQVNRQLTQAVWYFLLLAAIGIFMGLGISAWKWSRALILHNLHYSYRYLLKSLLIGFFLNNFLPTAVGGDAYRVVSTLPNSAYGSRALSAVVIERGVGISTLMAFGIAGVMQSYDSLISARIMLGALLTVLSFGVVAVLILERGWTVRFSERWRTVPILGAVHHSTSLLRGKRLSWLALIGASALFQVISIGVIFLFFKGLSVDITLAQCAVIAAFVGLAAAFPLSLNGLGITEGVFVATAMALGLDLETSLIAALSRRAFSLAISVVGGLLFLNEVHQARATTKAVNAIGFLRDAYLRATNVKPVKVQSTPEPSTGQSTGL